MKTITREELIETLSYDSTTGFFSWKHSWGRRKMDQPAGSLSKSDRYVYIWAGGTRISAHRLAWLYVYGEMPAGEIDHINGVRHHNRIANLRECARVENARNRSGLQSNNTSGESGVWWTSDRGKWVACVFFNGKQKRIGRFDSFDAAVSARQAAVKRHYGAFAPES